MTTFELDDERNIEMLIEEFLYLARYPDAEQLFNAYDGGRIRESTLYKICAYYDNQYGTKYMEDVEKLLDRKLNPDGKWVE